MSLMVVKFCCTVRRAQAAMLILQSVRNCTIMATLQAAIGAVAHRWATFPRDALSAPIRDGVVLNYNAMPGGGFTDYSIGQT